MSEDNCQTIKLECGLDKYFSEEICVSSMGFSTDSVSADKSSFSKKYHVAPLQMSFQQYLDASFDAYTGNFNYEVSRNILENTNFNIQQSALDAYAEKMSGEENLDITDSLTAPQQIQFYKECANLKHIRAYDKSVERMGQSKKQFLTAVKNGTPSHARFVSNSISFRVAVLGVTVTFITHIKLTSCPEQITLLPKNHFIKFVPSRPLKPMKYVKAIYACREMKVCEEEHSDHSSDSECASECDTDSDLESIFDMPTPNV
jgi:hypothetical protein